MICINSPLQSVRRKEATVAAQMTARSGHDIKNASIFILVSLDA